jgi:hypothetical protein
MGLRTRSSARLGMLVFVAALVFGLLVAIPTASAQG